MRFVTHLLALVGFLTVLFFIVVTVGLVHRSHTRPTVADDSILNITLDGELEEKTGFDPLKFSHQTSIREVERALHEGAKDGRIKGVFLNFGDNLPLAQAQELHGVIAEFRKSGKPVYAFADTFGEQGPGAGEYFLAAACDQVWLQPMGMVGLMGIAADEPFFKDFLARNGVEFQVTKREEYKTAFDNFTENGFTAANRKMTQSLLDDLMGQIVTGIAADRKIDPAVLRAAIDTGPITAEKAKDIHLVDEIDYRNNALDALEDEADGSTLTTVSDYLAALPAPATGGKTKIALIYTQGELVRHAHTDPLDPVADTEASDPRDVFNAFREASEDDHVKAIVFRVNSPGGSVIASETIHSGMLLAQDAGKPVIVSMGEMAGSGGYWIAADADRIIAEPATLTGSIGVLGGKPVIGDLAREHGVHSDTVSIGQNSDMDSVFHRLTPEQQAKQNQMLDDIYNQFKSVVSEGRKLPPEKVEEIAKGRVYTGQQAVAIGLVDELGGLDVAFARAKEAANLPAGIKYDIDEIPAAPSFSEWLRGLVSGDSNSDDIGMSVLHGMVGLPSRSPVLAKLKPYLSVLQTSPAESTVLMAPGAVVRP